jgi:hypothetical protein
MDKSKQKSLHPLSIEQINRLLLDINTKVDTNTYWLTTLLQNLILSIDTLNAKYSKLDQRLTYIEGFTAASTNTSDGSRKKPINRRYSSNMPTQFARDTLKTQQPIRKPVFETIDQFQENNAVLDAGFKYRRRRELYPEKNLRVN